MAKVVILMMDSFGVGGAKDAAAFGDEGANTFLHIAQNYEGLCLPNLEVLGLKKAGVLACGEEAPLKPVEACLKLRGGYGCMEEISAGKDTISGHWEMAGVPVREDFGHFPLDYPSFPADMVERICKRAGIDGILGNKAASGTVIIQELGEEHIATGKPIFYTSADSNLQIAAHEEKFGLERLYQLCEIAFEEVKPYNIGRVIARPFVGEKAGAFVRTSNRHDYAVSPFAPTVLDKAKAAGLKVVAIGKISDIYAGSGVTKKVKASGLEELWDATLAEVKALQGDGIVFTNFVNFDMDWGHRRDVKGYAEGLMYFDQRLPEIADVLGEDDVVFITADHGCDPTYKGTDHTRECVPVLMFGKGMSEHSLGRRKTYADIAETIAVKFGLEPFGIGEVL
ncbi:MAG: phosphopentomutase [Acetobacter sp.]|nr:phosphopentomutase [Acetobacter sp.]